MDESAPVVFDSLGMLVTGDPVAEIDGALAQAHAGLRRARSAGDSRTAARFQAWIDHRLDQRLDFDHAVRSDDSGNLRDDIG